MVQNPIRGDTAAALASSVEAGVHAGRLRPGDALPTVRNLAATLKLSPTTVAAAYKLLQARGLVSGLGRRGTRIAARPPTPAVSSRPPVPENAIDLATGNPDPALLPPLEPALRAIDPTPRLYDGPALVPALAAFAAGEFDADRISSRAMAIASGGLDAIERVLREHLRAGDRVAVEDPAFPGVLELSAVNGFVPVGVAVDDQGPVPAAMAAALRERPRALVVTPRAQNPTGAALSAPRASALRDVLKRAPDLLVIEDDHSAAIAGSPAVTLCHARRAWAVVRSVSKFLGPDLRVALVAGDTMTIARLVGRQALGARWVSHILQQLVLALWSDPSSGRRLARAADIYRQRREALLAALAAQRVPARGASGLNVWVPVREEAATCQALLERGWAVMPGERFRLAAPPGIRVTTAALAVQEAERFAADLAAVVRPRVGALA